MSTQQFEQQAGPTDANEVLLQVRLFGPPEALVGGSPLRPLRTRKGFWLLCLLALRADREVDRNWLAGTLWPDSLQEDALANLRRSLTDLRSALGPAGDVLEAPSAGTLRLCGADVDVFHFDSWSAGSSTDAWREALALARQALLEGCGEEWAAEERSVRESVCVELAHRLGEAAFAGKRFAEAADWFAEAARRDSFRETAWRRRMESLEKAGAYGAALEAYRLLRDQLWEALHTPPSPETTAVYQTIRQAARQGARTTGVEGATLAVTRSRPPQQPGPSTATGRLAAPLTGLIGREEELGLVIQYSQQTRLVTLTGSGGVGKTRLALEAAHALESDFAGGAWWVELAPLTSGSLIPQAIAQALGLQEESSVDLIESVARRLGAQKTLLVLDNCEHLVEESSAVARSLLQRIPGLTLLTTSRQPMELPGEQIIPVQPFPVAEGWDQLFEEIGRRPAVKLFVERAAERDPSFRLTADNAHDVMHICRRLDGIPLAIELAAARVQLLGVEQVALRLSDRFRLLSGVQRTALPHHRTLHSLIDWSYSLLAADEARLFRHIGVFSGGCAEEAAMAVSAAPGTDELDALDLLHSLVSRSLLQVQQTETGRRFWMLESIREFARKKLREAGEWDTALERHAVWCEAMAAAGLKGLEGADQTGALKRFAAELDNYRQTLDHLADRTRRLALTVSLGKFWQMSGSYTEGRERIDRALRETEEMISPSRVAGLRGAGVLARLQGDLTGARAYLESALALCEANALRSEHAATLTALGVVMKDLGDFTAARAAYESALRMEEGDGNEAGICRVLNNLGYIAMFQGELEAAEAFHRRALDIRNRRNDQYGVCSSLVNLGAVAFFRGDQTAAVEWYSRMESIAREAEFQDLIPFPLVNLAIIDVEQGRFENARVRLEEAISRKRALGDRRGIANALGVLSQMHLRSGALDAACSPLTEAIELVREIGDRRESCFLLELVVERNLRTNQEAEGATLMGGVAGLRANLRCPVLPSDQPLVAGMENDLLAALGDEGYTRCREAGAAATWEEMLEIGIRCLTA